MAYAEICQALDQFNGSLNGILAFFDVTVHGARMFNSIEDVVKTRPRGGGGTDYEAVFRFINRTSGNTTPTSIVIITDGEGMFPDPSMANNVPVLWLMTKNNKAPWGKSIVVK
nr:VWA-like domain-containing protein [uncultured Butyrivibrio sp.]